MIKPFWLDKKIDLSVCRKVRKILRELSLHTVCEESLCPNISECFHCSRATFMILGNICTRNCRFCGVIKGKPEKLDFDEPSRIKEAVNLLGLDYIIITSPARDDLDDGGAGIFCETVKAVRSLGPEKKVEILIPDFLGKKKSLGQIAGCGAKVIAHNVETVPSIYLQARKGADYTRSLNVLETVKLMNKDVFTKSGLMLGLGETETEVKEVLRDLRNVSCDFLTLGQYLPPSLKHLPLTEYIRPDRFDSLRDYALGLGFLEVESSPYARSSYMLNSFRSLL